MQFINLTTKDIKVVDNKGNTVIFPKSGKIASIHLTKSTNSILDNKFNLNGQAINKVLGLPEPNEDNMYIVPGIVLDALNGTRKDVIAPNNHTAVRDDIGNIVFYKEFIGFK